ncbi:MAG: ribosome silencing factor [Candidatus Schekmanbacteria bacterium RIFCSPHIGHO2_02_FULL_38_11]|uniref:Ribosomal silencing factor RsfS n=1 Tax=Candidatus Schekmanbacteria bacterium RIFCSPLOWO2_12_FULL_38_15 TaxID=1817883 RepID=A0A1F7SHT9_9BACT|nr:MAG: ribosome silencing factor [Candidatus Schekmanbacteria bacterium GWA2_38_9]OGL48900.1 MAG: ribosome silencing factor [Candidatus Schekmanbacteria bacterium RIFCSPHIGHO2_02_FULL_38_11]OGL49861.1 MAG: ribosome silencing factor [Candidatus Schekmanbacteria bacterium RIFCSPLOWO2_02_FULL_38_14]OGL52798.1 MAG: ribosome silencing factor [Candidatus Schekmanbacteria bacterium RIFCSPLOWO2_12_FULL_38_15]
MQAVQFALDKKAEEPVVFDVRKFTSIADYFFICHGNSDRQVKAITENIIEQFKNTGIKHLSAEGFGQCTWVILDYSDVIVHVFRKEERDYYNLEGLWGDATRVKIATAKKQG